MEGWQVVEDAQYIHVLPVNDTKEHNDIGPACACNPEVENCHDRIIVFHNAWDLREVQEFANTIKTERIKPMNKHVGAFYNWFARTFKRTPVFFNMWKSWKETPVIEFFAISFGSHRNGVAVLNFFIGTDKLPDITERMKAHGRPVRGV